MNDFDLKDIIKKINLIPEELQDNVIKNIENAIQKEIQASFNPVEEVCKKLDDIGFGTDKCCNEKIINIIIKELNEADYGDPFFYMSPVLCRNENHGKTGYVSNRDLEKLLKEEINNIEPNFIIEFAYKCNDVNLESDDVWIWKDGANWELWVSNTKDFAKEIKGWFNCCFIPTCDRDIKICYNILIRLNRIFPKKD